MLEDSCDCRFPHLYGISLVLVHHRSPSNGSASSNPEADMSPAKQFRKRPPTCLQAFERTCNFFRFGKSTCIHFAGSDGLQASNTRPKSIEWYSSQPSIEASAISQAPAQSKDLFNNAACYRYINLGSCGGLRPYPSPDHVQKAIDAIVEI